MKKLIYNKQIDSKLIIVNKILIFLINLLHIQTRLTHCINSLISYLLSSIQFQLNKYLKLSHSIKVFLSRIFPRSYNMHQFWLKSNLVPVLISY